MSERFKAISQQHDIEMQNLSAESELISKYKPTLIGAGNDHFVYEVENHPNSVIKINRESIKFALRYCLSRHITTDEYENDSTVQEKIDARVEYFKHRQQELREYFGKEHCAPVRYVKMRIPTIPSFYDELPIEDTSNIPEELLVVAMVQERALENFSEEDSVHTWYLKDDTDIYAYTDYTTSALTEPHGPLARPKRPDLSSEETRTVIRDFVERAIQYTEDTGHILDLNGVNNVVLTQGEDGSLSYTLVDALIPAINWESVIHDVGAIIEKQKENEEEELTHSDKNKLRVTVNYIRFINELANATMSENRLDQLTSSDPETMTTLRNILKQIYLEYGAK